MYDQKIQETIYGVTGRNDTSADVVTCVERNVHAYLSGIKQALEAQHAHRLLRKERRNKALSIDDLYAALAGTPELYGVKRCILLKELAKSTENETLPCGDGEASIDSLQTQITQLDDGSDTFRTFNDIRQQDMIHADLLTRDMSSEEYLEYSRKGRTRFIGRTKQFCEWLGWEPQPNAQILTAFAWLGPYRVKRLVHAALLHRATGTGELKLKDFSTQS